NKLELIDGRSRCAFPFVQREQAEAHFAAWTETLARWQGVSRPPVVRKSLKNWKVEVNGFAMELAPRPIDLRIPLDGGAFRRFYECSWRRDLWSAQPPGKE